MATRTRAAQATAPNQNLAVPNNQPTASEPTLVSLKSPLMIDAPEPERHPRYTWGGIGGFLRAGA